MIREWPAARPSIDEIVREYSCLRRGQPRRREEQVDRCRVAFMSCKDALQTASRNPGCDLPGRYPDNSGALFRGQDQRIKAVDPEARRYADTAILPAVGLEAPHS